VGVHLLPFDRLDGIGIGVVPARDQDRGRPSEAWLGRVLAAFGRARDGGQPLPLGPSALLVEGAAGRGPSPARSGPAR